MNYKLLKPTTLYEEAERRRNELVELRKLLMKQENQYPIGKIHVITSHNTIQFYVRENSSDRSGKYLSKKQISLIKLYLHKAYNQGLIKLLNLEIANLEKFILKSTIKNIPINQCIRNIYSEKNKETKAYITPYDMSDDDYINQWKSEEYVGKKYRWHCVFYNQ